jgi:CRISPR-associated endonuclease/helicase Cas3
VIEHSYQRFWGKARPTVGEGEAFHPLAAHCLDVAAVAMELDGIPELSPPQLGFLIALHDIGKFARSFQAKARFAWPASVLGHDVACAPDPGHEAMGLHLLTSPSIRPLLDPLFQGWLPSQRAALLRAVCGHHGRPPVKLEPGPSASQFGAEERAAAAAFIGALMPCFAPTPIADPGDDVDLHRLTWRLAGLTVLADWIGSSRHFPYATVSDVADLPAYLLRARGQARHALAVSGLTPAAIAPARGLSALFGPMTPTPIQHWAETVPLPDGPVLAVIEDMTGAGKTEAALVLAHRLMAADRADGLFIAMPTMATANAMHARMQHCWHRLFTAHASPSLILSHGRAWLDDRFTASIMPEGAAANELGDEPAGAQCAAWLADDRRKALLAHVGVGTVDQAFLSVLPVKHAALRQRGLSRKVLVVDEAHAFDPYMRQEMLALLRFHAALGGSVILLSATLTRQVRQQVADAFREGLGVASVALTSAAYPLATLAATAGVSETPSEPREGLARHTPVCRIADEVEALQAIRGAVAAGAAVGWVRNTVDEAIAAAESLSEAGLEPLLFHARFAMVDRLRIEAEVMRRFGKSSEPGERRGVVVATQVIEQSLDLDFDLLISDLAPADLLIQRAGRLWRHRDRRHRPLPAPMMLLLAPEPVEDAPADWLREHRGSAAVYRDPALLWRSARAILAAGGITAPEGLRQLIEASGSGEAPAALLPASERAEGKGKSQEAVARMNVLRLEGGYDRQQGAWEPDVNTPTRLENQEQVVLRLARWDGATLRPYAEAETAAKAWALSEVSVAKHQVMEVPMLPEVAAACELAKRDWSIWERESKSLRFAPINDGGRTVMGFAGIHYLSDLGLVPDQK